MLSCREVTRLVSESQERRLGLQERLSLRTHMAMCSACRRFETQMATVRSALRHFAGSTIDADLPGDPEPKGD